MNFHTMLNANSTFRYFQSPFRYLIPPFRYLMAPFRPVWVRLGPFRWLDRPNKTVVLVYWVFKDSHGMIWGFVRCWFRPNNVSQMIKGADETYSGITVGYSAGCDICILKQWRLYNHTINWLIMIQHLIL